MKKRSMRGLAAALVLTMALPVTAFGAETVQVDGYDRMEGEAAKYQLSISNVTGKTTVAGKEAYVCQAPVKVSAVDELQTFEVTKYLSAEDFRCQLGQVRILLYNGKEAFYIHAFLFFLLELALDFIRLGLQGMLFVLVALRHFHKPLVRKFANDIILIDTLENGIQFPNPLLYLRQTLFLL